ncbi:hypothetical protein FIBSPDRAFT_900255 [Athelia psychrophila]|uniref:Uncharacterized protein n=1 Tax=Athelia psychrophila TaxID=1759441 RepID=A0A165YNJ0_9AGAM|nr:hypothetical protein FIBSPDRAFT_900255 [Fibularhizoctonia sp. CBS 109695]
MYKSVGVCMESFVTKESQHTRHLPRHTPPPEPTTSSRYASPVPFTVDIRYAACRSRDGGAVYGRDLLAESGIPKAGLAQRELSSSLSSAGTRLAQDSPYMVSRILIPRGSRNAMRPFLPVAMKYELLPHFLPRIEESLVARLKPRYLFSRGSRVLRRGWRDAAVVAALVDGDVGADGRNA